MVTDKSPVPSPPVVLAAGLHVKRAVNVDPATVSTKLCATVTSIAATVASGIL
jgi:hypothetical protein